MKSMMTKAVHDLEESVEILKKMKPFGNLDESLLQKIAASLKKESYPVGSYIVRQGEPSKHVLFLVVEGKVELLVQDRSKNITVTGYRGPFEIFGETVFFTDEEYPGSACSVEDTVCYLLPQEVFEEVVVEDADFAAFFSRLLADRLRILYQKFRFFEEEDVTEEAFGKLVSDIMVSSVITCTPDATVAEIASIMHDHNISSVVVVEGRKPLGIITEGDLVSKVLREENLQESASLTARELMSRKPITIDAQSFSYQAFLLMVKNRIKHVVVVDEEGMLEGIVAIRDVIKSRKTGSLAIVNRIEAGGSIDEIAMLRPDVDQVLNALLMERATVSEINSLITEFYDRITRRIIELSEREMIKEGYGPPPVGYCFINMGSSGRKEQYARTDQDNGIVFEDVPKEKESSVRKYFLAMGEKVVAGLEKYGFERCNGGVMANNKDWCRSFQSWRNIIRHWIHDLDPQNVMLMSIFLDFRFIYGKKSLHDLLRNFVARSFRESNLTLTFLVQDSIIRKVPISIFRQIQTERSGEHRGKINLKSSACVHIVDCTRAFSLESGIIVTNTFERLHEIERREILNKKDVQNITAAYETLMMFRIRDSLAMMRKGLHPDNHIDPEELTAHEYSLLKEALIMVKRLQSIARSHFRVSIM